MSFLNTQNFNPDNLGILLRNEFSMYEGNLGILSEMEEEGRMGEGWISLNDEEGEASLLLSTVLGCPVEPN